MVDTALLDLSKSKVSGFSTVTTYRYEGFTEAMISELEQILQRLGDDPKTQNIIQFFTNLHKHLTSTAGEHIDITPLSDTLITQLYNAYRKAGFKGTRNQMLLDIDKHLEVADDTTFRAGISKTAAMTAVQWKDIYTRHLTDPSAHRKVYQTLNPTRSFNAPVTTHYSSIFGSIGCVVGDDTIPIEKWNNRCGTLVLRYRLKNSDNQIAELAVGDNKITISETNNTLVFKVADKTYTFKTDPTLEKDRLILSYNQQQLTLATIMDIQKVTTFDLNKPTLTIPNGIVDDLTDGTVYQLDYYPLNVDDEEIRFLLN